MKSLMKLALVCLLAISTTAYAGNNKHKKSDKKAHPAKTCPASCPRKGCQ